MVPRVLPRVYQQKARQLERSLVLPLWLLLPLKFLPVRQVGSFLSVRRTSGKARAHSLLSSDKPHCVKVPLHIDVRIFFQQVSGLMPLLYQALDECARLYFRAKAMISQ